MIQERKWRWRGLPGHFCCASSCRFRLCTDIGGYRISTVGAMYFKDGNEMEEIGMNRHYETMVFKIGLNDRIIPSELDTDYIEKKKRDDPYQCDRDAEEMHLKMCYKWALNNGMLER